MYTVVDIETTGKGIYGNRITEIALYNVDNGEITESFCSLVNPECAIPEFITGLTGITNAMVNRAPTFDNLAEEIDTFCRDRIFVAHSVNFDYPIVREEFARCGISFQRKKLCTVRLSRKVFPGLHSYSLGKLCTSLGIPLNDRHRAGGDAKATALLLQRILEEPGGAEKIAVFLNARSQESTLPPLLPKDDYNQLPEAPGIYYFKDEKGRILYVGKAINVKKRVLGHFYDRTEKELALCRETAGIDFNQSGSELLALLMETAAIKKHFPPYNRAQKSIRPSFGLFQYADRDGIFHLAINRISKGQQSVKVFYSEAEARIFLETLCENYQLCAKYCHLQEGVSHCGHFRVPDCPGVCRGQEEAASYNMRVKEALKSLQFKGENQIIIENGRVPDEKAILYMESGVYRGYCFVPQNYLPENIADIEQNLELQINYPESDRIIENYRFKHPERFLNLNLIAEKG